MSDSSTSLSRSTACMSVSTLFATGAITLVIAVPDSRSREL